MNNDFVQKKTTPSTEEYLKASVADLIGRMNANPPGLPSEMPFIKAVLDVKTSESIRQTNKNLVLATWILVIATLLLSLISFIIKKP